MELSQIIYIGSKIIIITFARSLALRLASLHAAARAAGTARAHQTPHSSTPTPFSEPYRRHTSMWIPCFAPLLAALHASPAVRVGRLHANPWGLRAGLADSTDQMAAPWRCSSLQCKFGVNRRSSRITNIPGSVTELQVPKPESQSQLQGSSPHPKPWPKAHHLRTLKLGAH